MVKKKPIRDLLTPFQWGMISWLASCVVIWILWEKYGGGELSLRDIVLGFFTPLGIGLAVWRSMSADQHIEIAEETLKTSHQQINESRDQARASLLQNRYQSATNMLASNSVTTRIGGVQILRKMAEEYIEDYHIPIMELLAEFIRHPIKTKGYYASDVRLAVRAIVYRGNQQKNREKKEIQKNERWHINLTGANLSHLNLGGGDFTHITLYKVNFTGTNLSHATGITQAELNTTHYLSGHRPPILEGARCAESGEMLTDQKIGVDTSNRPVIA